MPGESIQFERGHDFLRTSLVGELDLASRQLSNVIEPELVQHPAVVEFDLSAVTFMDSTGVRWLLQTERTINAYGGQIVITSMSEPVRRLFDITGLLEHFGVAVPEP